MQPDPGSEPARRQRVWLAVGVLVVVAALIALVVVVVANNDSNPAAGPAQGEEVTRTSVAGSTASSVGGPVQTLATTVPVAPPSAPVLTTVPPTSVVSTPSGTIVVAAPSHADTYDRDRFGSGWIDADRDCQNTRAEVLIEESHTPVTFTSSGNCTVATGDWIDPWSGTENTSARALDVDHTVPLANAWRSGAWAWTPEQRIAFANETAYTDHLIGIPLGENRSKGHDGPEAMASTRPRVVVPLRNRVGCNQSPVASDRK
jgi:hypothetical protein